MLVRPIAFKNIPTSLSNAPPPEIKAFNDPPNCDLIFFLTNFSQIKFSIFSINESFFLIIFFYLSLTVLLIKYFLNPFALLKFELIF